MNGTEFLSQQMMDKVVSEMSKELRNGKVLIGWSQNSDFRTTGHYAMRAKRDQLLISIPVTSDEVRKVEKKDSEDALFSLQRPP